MADLYVCPKCDETEDCACDRLASALRDVEKARKDARRRLGELLVTLVSRMPAQCSCCEKAPPGTRCPLCLAVHYAKEKINDAAPLTAAAAFTSNAK